MATLIQRLNKQKSLMQGQATIEALILSMMILLLTVCFITCCYLGIVKISSEYLLHEALVCSATFNIDKTTPNCDFDLRQRLKLVLIFQKVEKIEWIKKRNSIGVIVTASGLRSPYLGGLRITQLKLQKHLALPLQ